MPQIKRTYPGKSAGDIYPMHVPGSMRQKVQEDIERKLDGLFG